MIHLFCELSHTYFLVSRKTTNTAKQIKHVFNIYIPFLEFDVLIILQDFTLSKINNMEKRYLYTLFKYLQCTAKMESEPCVYFDYFYNLPVVINLYSIY